MQNFISLVVLFINLPFLMLSSDKNRKERAFCILCPKYTSKAYACEGCNVLMPPSIKNALDICITKFEKTDQNLTQTEEKICTFPEVAIMVLNCFNRKQRSLKASGYIVGDYKSYRNCMQGLFRKSPKKPSRRKKRPKYHYTKRPKIQYRKRPKYTKKHANTSEVKIIINVGRRFHPFKKF